MRIWLMLLISSAAIGQGPTNNGQINGGPPIPMTATGVPQIRTVGPAAVTAGVPATSVPCSSPAASSEQCIGPSTSLISFTGIPLLNAAAGTQVMVQTEGKAMAVFDNTPIQGDIAVVGVGTAHDSGATNSLQILCTQGLIGRILSVTDSTHGIVNVIGLGKRGDLMTSDCMDPLSMPAYIKANQNVSAGPTGPAGVVYYGTSGALTNVRCFIGSTTSSASTGAWSISIAPAGLTTLISVQTNAKSTGTTASTTFQPSTVTTSTSTISGQVYGYATSVVGLVPLTQATTATTVMVEACGT